jgi:hypothetical protein
VDHGRERGSRTGWRRGRRYGARDAREVGDETPRDHDGVGGATYQTGERPADHPVPAVRKYLRDRLRDGFCLTTKADARCGGRDRRRGRGAHDPTRLMHRARRTRFGVETTAAGRRACSGSAQAAVGLASPRLPAALLRRQLIPARRDLT